MGILKSITKLILNEHKEENKKEKKTESTEEKSSKKSEEKAEKVEDKILGKSPAGSSEEEGKEEPKPETADETTKRKEEDKFDKKMGERKKDFLQYYVEHHRKKAKEDQIKNLKQLIENTHIMYNLCYTDRGTFMLKPDKNAHFAIAHPQIDKKDPLRFFVTRDEAIIINPVIINHTKHSVDRAEGCLSYPDKRAIKIQRFNKITIEYATISRDGFSLTPRITENLSGVWAQAYQHELCHLNGKYIYDEDACPEDAL